MKRFSKILSVGLSALILMSGSTIMPGAATCKNRVQVKTVKCSGSACSGAQAIVSKLKACKSCKSSNKQQTKTNGGYCPNGNCSTSVPVKKAEKQSSNSVAEKPKAAEFSAEYEAEVISLVNAERAKQGLAALKKDSGAVNVARVRAKEIVSSFSHTRPDGRSCFTAASDLGVTYRSAGENIAYGYPTPAAVVSGWMNSDGHRKNILSSSFTKIGIGCFSSGGVLYWSQFFIG